MEGNCRLLRRDERTVKRWEKERGLPVYRVPGSARGGVFAYAEELAEWLKAPNVVWEATAAAADNPPPDESGFPAIAVISPTSKTAADILPIHPAIADPHLIPVSSRQLQKWLQPNPFYGLYHWR